MGVTNIVTPRRGLPLRWPNQQVVTTLKCIGVNVKTAPVSMLNTASCVEKTLSTPPDITVPLAHYGELVEAAEELMFLKAHGVDNWEGYDRAMQELADYYAAEEPDDYLRRMD